jgi:hypothetical protein
VLKVEFDDPAGFRSNYLSDLSEGGLRLNTEMEVGHRLTLNISFLGFLDPLQVDAVVQWSLPASHPEGPASGLAFINLTNEARNWINDVFDASTQIFIAPEEPSRVLLLEAQPFLQEVYGQEVRNWAELRDEEPLELIAQADPAAWLEAVCSAPATLAILDVDGLAADGLELYRTVRDHAVSSTLPMIVLGEAPHVERFHQVADDLLLCLKKPLRFGVLMNTVRMLARDNTSLTPRPFR